MRQSLAAAGIAAVALLAAGCGASTHQAEVAHNRPGTRSAIAASMLWTTDQITSATAVRLEIPATWRSYRVFAGDTGGTEWVNPKDPAERIDIVSTGCIGCMQNAQGQWDVRSLFGTSSIRWTSVSTNLMQGEFVNTSHSDPYVANGNPANPAHGQSHDPYIAHGFAEIVPQPIAADVELEVWAPASLAQAVIRHVAVQTVSAWAPIAQLVRWSHLGDLYGVLWPTSPGYSSEPPEEIFLLPKGFSVPATLKHWPPRRFRAVAVMDSPQTEIGTGTGTLWNNMQSSIYWLTPGRSGVLPPSGTALHLSTSQQAVLDVPAGHLFAVPWPSPSHPDRTIFLEPVGFAMPTEITEWPPQNFRIVAVYPLSALQNAPTLQYAVRMLTAAQGVRIPGP